MADYAKRVQGKRDHFSREVGEGSTEVRGRKERASRSSTSPREASVWRQMLKKEEKSGKKGLGTCSGLQAAKRDRSKWKGK